jgi:hypothetical protein
MLAYAIVLLAITAVGGLVLASYVLRGKLAPWMLSLLHAGLGAGGLILALLTILNGESRVLLPFVILTVAALLGFYLASHHLKQKLPSNAVVIVHAGVAVLGFLALVSMVFIHNLV